MLGMTTTSDPGTSGIKDIAGVLGGGIQENSLVLIEGESRTGKTVLSQHIAYGVLQSKGSPVAYYSSESNSESIIEHMSSMSMDIAHDLATDRLRIYKIGSKNPVRNPKDSLQLIIDHIVALPPRFKLVLVDSPSQFLTDVSSEIKIDFLQVCKELCARNRTVALALDTHVFERKTLARAYSMSDYYIRLRSQDMVIDTGKLDTRVIKLMEVTKLCGAERSGQAALKFEIKPRIGIQLLPFVRIKI